MIPLEDAMRTKIGYGIVVQDAFQHDTPDGPVTVPPGMYAIIGRTLVTQGGDIHSDPQLFQQYVDASLSIKPVGAHNDIQYSNVSLDAFELLTDEPIAKDTLNLKGFADEALSHLSPRERRILQLRFGLEDGRSRTLEEIGGEYDITRERVRQIEKKALEKLRHTSSGKSIADTVT